MFSESSGTILTTDYKLFLTCIFLAGLLTGGVIGAIVLNYKEAQWRKVNDNVHHNCTMRR